MGLRSDGTCVAFKGTLKGNGRSIKNLHINTTDNEKFKGAGLFCGLRGATIENLVIDASCSFSGSYAGTLGAIVNGSLSVVNVINNAPVNGQSQAGGFIGSVDGLKYNCQSLAFDGCVNNATITVSGQGEVGGFVGYLSHVKEGVTIKNSQNNGMIEGTNYAGGFIGYLENDNQTDALNVTVTNSANNNSISAKEGMACGFFCVGNKVDTNVENSINRGNVNAKKLAYGIASLTVNAKNVVSMGVLTGEPDSDAFWQTSSHCESIYRLDGLHSNHVTGVTTFEYNPDTGFFDVNNTNEHVHDLLNDYAWSQRYSMLWTAQLGLTDGLTIVSVSGEFHRSYAVELGTLLKNVGNLGLYLNSDEYGVVSCGNKTQRIVYSISDTVSGNMSIMIGKLVNVSISAPINEEKKFVSGETLEQVADVFGFSPDDYIVKNGENVLGYSSVIDSNMELTLYHNVILTGYVHTSYIMKHGTTFGQNNYLSDKLSLPFIVYNSTDPSQVFNSNTMVTRDIHATVIKVDKQDFLIWFDEGTTVTVDKIKEAVGDLIVTTNEDHLWVEVVSQDDGSFIVSVIHTEDSGKDIASALLGCSKS